jgi:hypothetical protein
MPGKSRRGRGKHSARSKKRQGASTIAAQQRVAADKPPAPAVPTPSKPTPITAPTGARYPYVVAELRRIGILAGIMLVILVVLALVLP